MSGILEGLNHMSAAAIAAVLNSLWQAAAVAAVARAGMRFFPRMNAATRHALWWAVLIVVLLLPLAPNTIPQRTQLSVVTRSVELVAPAPPDLLPQAPLPAVAPSNSTLLEVRAGSWPTWIFLFWVAIVVCQLGRIAWSYRYLRAVKRSSHQASPDLRRNFDAWLMSCSVGRPARLLVSSDVKSPLAVGFRSPAVVLPEPLLTQFQEPELDHVLLHELAHIARRDDWTNLSARLAGAILGLNPVAAWILRRIEREREIACDDWVVSMTGAARPYAASLARLFEVCMVRQRMLLASPMAGRASHLGERIEMLLERSREFTPKASIIRVVIATAALLLIGAAGALTPHWLAFAQLPDPAPAMDLPEASQYPAPPAPRAARAPRQAPAPPAPLATPLPDAADLPPAPPAPAATPAPPRAPFLVRLFAARPATPPSAPYLASQAPPPPPPAPASTPSPALPPAQARPPAPPPPPARNGSFLAALVAAGYGDLPVDDIINLKNAGVSPAFLVGINQAGWGKLSPQEMIQLSNNGVSPEYIHQAKSAGIRGLTLKEVVGLANSGVRLESIHQIHSLGFGPYTAQQAIEIAQCGLRTELFRALKDAGLGSAPLNEIVEAQQSGLGERNLREARQYGSNLSLKQIIRLKSAGVI